MNYALFAKDAVPHMQKAVGIDALAYESLTQQLVVGLDVLILPQLLHGLAATALLLARLEGEGMHNHVSSLGTNDITKRLYMWDGLFSLRTHENGETFVFCHDDLTHLHPLHGGISLGGVRLCVLCPQVTSAPNETN